ncbi:acyl-CoA thioesterase [uncultured Amnibacterium sp.]|uniref:acyl-CoA thioesterase n=1 Tax=uncultured Amnibacterium sp. TaxID=1631851 RepID=UPI0035CA49E3
MRIHVPVTLRWSDIDAYAHVNNVAMLRLLEEVRIRAFWSAGDPADGSDDVALQGPAILDGRPGSNSISLIAHQQAQYLRPIPYQREPLDIEVWIGRIGGSSLQLCYEVYSAVGAEPRTLFTRAESTLVLADAATSTPRRITDAERAAWQPYVEEPVDFTRRR